MFETSQDGDSDNGTQDVNNEGYDPSADPNLSDDNQDPQTSPVEPQDDNTDPDTSQDQGDKEQKSLGESIQDALDKMSGDDETKDSPPEEGADKEKGRDKESGKTDDEKKDEKSSDEISEEEKNAPKEINEHPAFKKVISERTQARRERDEALQQVETFKTDAERYGQIQNYLNENKVTNDDAANALRLTALANKDPHAFFKEIAGMAQQYGEQLGYFLPADLQQKVKEGVVDVATAKELAKNRADNAVKSRQIEHNTQNERQRSTQAQAEEHKNLATQWATQKSQTDLDLQKKMPLVADAVARIWQSEGVPKNQKDAWDRMERAYEQVSNRLKGFTTPARPETRQKVPPSTQMKAGSQRAPTTYEESMDAAFEAIESGQRQ